MRGIIFILLLFFKTSFSQIPNNSFENWNNGNPDWWQTTNIPIVPNSVVPDSSAYEGLLAVKGIVVSDIRNKPFAPYLGIYGPSAQGFPIGQSYEYMDGWCRLFLKPGDRFRGDIRIYDSHQEPIGDGKVIIDSSIASWTPFKIQINYYGLLLPVSCTLFFTITDSTLLSSGQIGSYFVVDQISLGGTVDINNINTGWNVNIYPNPARTELHILNTYSAKGFNYSLYDVQGKKVLTKKQFYADEIINLEKLLPGVYFLNCVSKDISFRKKVILE